MTDSTVPTDSASRVSVTSTTEPGRAPGSRRRETMPTWSASSSSNASRSSARSSPSRSAGKWIGLERGADAHPVAPRGVIQVVGILAQPIEACRTARRMVRARNPLRQAVDRQQPAAGQGPRLILALELRVRRDRSDRTDRHRSCRP